jgi:hypothetical protein
LNKRENGVIAEENVARAPLSVTAVRASTQIKAPTSILTLCAQELVESVLEVELRRPRFGWLQLYGNILIVVQVLSEPELPKVATSNLFSDTVFVLRTYN